MIFISGMLLTFKTRNMRPRLEILKDIVGINGDLSTLQNEILEYPWDIAEPLLSIGKKDILAVLNRFIEKLITAADLEEWANMIECRDDLGFDEERQQDAIFTLANPDLNGNITEDAVKRIIDELSD